MVGASEERVARFPKLPPGHYRFHVEACNEDNVWSGPDAAVLSITVQPQFWQTGWFRVSVILFCWESLPPWRDTFPPRNCTGSCKRFQQREALEKERARIARDLHDQLGANLTQVRCNLVTVKDGKMADYSAGHISSDEAKKVIEHLGREIDWQDLRFYPGKSYRHLMVIKTLNVPGMLELKTTPPHDIIDQPVKTYLPAGPQSDNLLKIMEKSKKILGTHQINRIREVQGKTRPI